MLDQILERLVEREEPIATIVAAGFDRDIVLKVGRLLDLAEYKRRQAAPGVKVTLKNFGRDRRYPIVNRFRDSGAPLPEPDRALAQGRRGEQDRSLRFLKDCVQRVDAPEGTSVRPRAPCGWDRASTASSAGAGRSRGGGRCRRRSRWRAAAVCAAFGSGRAGGERALAGSACPAHRRAAATIAAPADRSPRCRPARRWCRRCSSTPATSSRRDAGNCRSGRARCDSGTHSASPCRAAGCATDTAWLMSSPGLRCE